ncbi:MAG TPA: hypothetical protein VIL77_14975 [Gaiellaceae bacterium]
MKHSAEARHSSALARDAAARRVRFATQISVATMVALGGTFAALAAGSTQAKKAIARVPGRRVPAAAVLASAPAPPLVGAQGSAPSSAAPAAPAATPTQSYQPPVVVSGGS